MTWTLEKAKNQLSEVVRRALAHEPQIVVRGGRDAVVVVAREDYEKLVAPADLFSFLRESPVAQAVASGEVDERAFERPQHLAREVDL